MVWKKKLWVCVLVTITTAAGLGIAAGRQAWAQTDEGFSVSVRSRCDGQYAVFDVENTGKTWPDLGTFAIYDTAANVMVMRRELRLKHGQTAKFRVRGANRMGDVGLAIDPHWFKRAPGFDAMVRCR